MMDQANMTIGRLAKAANVGVETIRYYQQRELLPVPAATSSAFRYYPVELVDRIRFIKRAQELGFSLSEIGELLELNDGADRRTIRRITQHRLDTIREKILDLQRIDAVLTHLVNQCEGTSKALACPIIATLSLAPTAGA
jgi:Hg(II)-responsive transcriptional regulator